MKIIKFQELKSKSEGLGFSAFGVARVEKLTLETERLNQWLEKGCHADMSYLERNIEKRENPALLVDKAQSVIVTLTNYYSDFIPSSDSPRIARFAYGEDYHTIIKEKLRILMEGMEGRCFVDSAPVLEHEWARRAGLGWIGKNTLLINKKWGSFCFIGIILTSAVFDEYSEAEENKYCGTCTRCIDICPTKALSSYSLDARKCISYHTIENKNNCPSAIKKVSGNWIFGCDICQEVCPWNKKAFPHTENRFIPGEFIKKADFKDWLQIEQNTFRELFKNSPLKRAGIEKIHDTIKKSVEETE